jgi:hypothetical protein
MTIIDECTLSVIKIYLINCFELCPRQGAGGSHVVLRLISNKKCFILLKKNLLLALYVLRSVKDTHRRHLVDVIFPGSECQLL